MTEVARRLLVTVAGGYRLGLDTSELDLRTFEQLATTGRRSLAAGEHVAAAASRLLDHLVRRQAPGRRCGNPVDHCA
ncbi:hypothetical protein AB0K25_21125 [Micromonospora sp. NPDC049257]|uniref:hypothetical protein n=1 Tax=Micromonospora sp. NPDC049257 TaxID=3155771 RepID=UPI00341DD4DE